MCSDRRCWLLPEFVRRLGRAALARVWPGEPWGCTPAPAKGAHRRGGDLSDSLAPQSNRLHSLPDVSVTQGANTEET